MQNLDKREIERKKKKRGPHVIRERDREKEKAKVENVTSN